MEYMCFKQLGDISILNSGSLELVEMFTYIGRSVSSTESDINMHRANAWTSIDRLSIKWESEHFILSYTIK